MQVKSSVESYKQILSYTSKEAKKAAPSGKNGVADVPAAEESLLSKAEESGVLVELSGEEPAEASTQEETSPLALLEEKKDALLRFAEENKTPIKASTSAPQDQSGALTRRLVAAISLMEVHKVISEANQNMMQLRTAAASGDAKTAKSAQAAVKRLERLIRRGRRKVSDLNKEEDMRLEQRQAERQQKQRRAEAIKKELREQVRKRKEREKKYLRDNEARQVNAPSNFKLDAATEAKIAQQAQMQATMEAAAPMAEAAAVDTGGAVGEAVGGEVAGATADGGAAGAEVSVE